jgi:hypothetical protein
MNSQTNSKDTSSEVIGEGDTIKLPDREYGYCTVPFSWAELVEIITKENNLAKLSRNVDQQRDYEIFRRDLSRHWLSIYDYILCSKFGFQKQGTEGDWEARPRLSDVSEVFKTLELNDFPYNFEDGISHYILWKTFKDITQQEIDETRKEILNKKDVIDTLFWMNPPHLKSLPGIDHVHFLCLHGEKVWAEG